MSLLNDILTEKMMCCQGQVEAQFIAPCASKNAYSLVENTLSGVSSRKSNTGSRYMNEENIARTTDPATAHLPLVVGVDLGGTQVRVAVLRGARLLARVSWLTGEDPTPEGVISHIMRGIRQVLNEAKVTLDQLAGIGIGVPGPVNCHSGIVFSPPNLLGWDEVPVRDIFSQEFKMPVFVENDANAAALAEYMFGAGRAYHEVVYMTLGTGIGSGVITNGKLLEGVAGMAAELGHMTIDWQGELCNCGHVGCLETFASGTGIANYASMLILGGMAQGLREFALEHRLHEEQVPFRVDARTVALAAEAGLPAARDIIIRAEEELGTGLVTVIHIFNPQIIILGGSVVQIGELLLEPVRRTIEERAIKVLHEATRIVMAELGPDAGLVGAGALIYYYKRQ